MPAKKKNPDELFSKREIEVALNNALIAAMRPATLGGEIPKHRMLKLGSYTRAFTEEILEHVAEGLLRPEELVLIFITVALYVETSLHEVPAQEAPGYSELADSVIKTLFREDK